MNHEEERLRMSVRFPILPDAEDASVRPAEDGHPWLKSCSVCACRTHDPQHLGDAYRRVIMTRVPGYLFYCLHRGGEEAEVHRVCAGYACLHPEQELAK
jgi:hypothetical protein